MERPAPTATGRTRRWLVLGLIALVLVGLAVAATSALRLYRRHGRPPPPPRQTDVGLIQGWMTVPYIARAFRVPPEVVAEAAGAPREGGRPRSLDELASATGRRPEDVLAAVQAAVAEYQATRPSGPGPDGGAKPGRGPPPPSRP